METNLKIKRNFFRIVLNILGVSTIGLIATCCKYGYDISDYRVNLKGVVKSKDALQSIPGIKVEILNDELSGSSITDNNGEFSINGKIKAIEYPKLKFSDVDGKLNGSFETKDTVITSNNRLNIEIKLNRNE